MGRKTDPGRLAAARLYGALTAAQPDLSVIGQLETELAALGGDPDEVRANVEASTAERLAIVRRHQG